MMMKRKVLMKRRYPSRLLCFLVCLAGANPAVLQERWNSLSGFVRDADSGEPLPYANVYLQESGRGGLTNQRGYFVIPKIPNGVYTIKISLLGYGSWEEEISLSGGDVIREVRLHSSPIEMGSVTKTAERERFEREVQISQIGLSLRQLQTAPALAEADVFRTVQLLPGVVGRSDFSSQLYVRGGTPDQNLVLLDGVTVYNPFHLGGVFSTFNVDAIKTLEFHSGGFPVEYGGRLSSVLSILNRDGNSHSWQGCGGVSLLSARGVLEGPIPGGSVLLALRRTYFDQLFKGTDFEFPYYFYDIQGKMHFDLSHAHRITLSGFYGDDVLDFEREGDAESVGVDLNWVWGNRTTSASWRWIAHPEFFSEIQITRSRFDNRLQTELETSAQAAVELANRITDWSGTADIHYLGLKNHAIKWGGSYSSLDFSYAFTLDQYPLFNYREKPRLAAGYIQDQWALTRTLRISPGLRMEYFSMGDRWQFSPRMGLQYHFRPDVALKAAVGNYYQYLATVASADQNFSIMDLWLPITARYQPQSATHVIAGIEWWLSSDLIMTVEGYHKSFRHLLELNENGEFANEDDDFFELDGRAYGAEILVKKSAGKLQGWLGYSYSLTQRTRDGQHYPPKHDRRHAFYGVTNWAFAPGWVLGAVYTFGSGLPYTPVLGKYMHYEWDQDQNVLRSELYDRWGDKNSARYPAYHRMDISIRRQGRLFGLQIMPYLQIINLFNRENVFFYYWDHESNPSRLTTVTMFPFLPTLGVDFAF